MDELSKMIRKTFFITPQSVKKKKKTSMFLNSNPMGVEACAKI